MWRNRDRQWCLSSPTARVLRRAAMACVIAAALAVGIAHAQSYGLSPWAGSLPGDAVIAGEAAGGAPVYVCVVDSWGGEHPGALGEDGVCRVAWGGRGHAFAKGFKVLVSASAGDGSWAKARAGSLPGGAFRAGDDGGPIYVCRVDTSDGLLPGRLRDDGWCYVAAGDQELTFTDGYEVLVD